MVGSLDIKEFLEFSIVLPFLAKIAKMARMAGIAKIATIEGCCCHPHSLQLTSGLTRHERFM